MQRERPLETLTERAIGCAIAVHRAFGPGLLKSVYKACLRIELEEIGLKVDTERRIPLRYRGRVVPADLVCDLLVEEQLLLELKSVEQIHPVHVAQVITYLKLSGYPVGLLINFNTTSLRNGLRRLEHPDVYTPRMWRAHSDRDTTTAPRWAPRARLPEGAPSTETPTTTTDTPRPPAGTARPQVRIKTQMGILLISFPPVNPSSPPVSSRPLPSFSSRRTRMERKPMRISHDSGIGHTSTSFVLAERG